MSTADYEATSAQARYAEELGFSAVFVRDHLGLPQTDGRDDALECFTVLGGLARDTTRVRIGSLVACTPWRNPALVAKSAATIDVMSGGRLILGLGAGVPRIDGEFRRYGYDDESSDASRARGLAEAVELIGAMWANPHGASFSGRYYRIEDARCVPAPLQRPRPPIVVGGSGERITLPAVVARADGWHCGLPPARYAEKAAVVERLCEQSGRDPKSLYRLASQIVILDEAPAAKRRFEAMLEARPALAMLRTNTLCGPPEAFLERVEEFAALGVNTVVAYLWEPELAPQLVTMAAIGESVIPRLSGGDIDAFC